MRTIEIRPAVIDEARSIAEVHIRSFLASYAHLPRTRRAAETGLERRVEVWQRRLTAPDQATVVARIDGRVVGFIHMGASTDEDADETTGHIFSIHVDPAHTDAGIGGELVAAAISGLARDGYRKATLWAVCENERAHRFYERLGWRRDGATRLETLAVGDEEGNLVKVCRFRLDLPEVEGQ